MAVLHIIVWHHPHVGELKPKDQLSVHRIELGQEAAYDWMFVYTTLPSGRQASIHVLYDEDFYYQAPDKKMSVLSIGEVKENRVSLTVQLESL